jgi:hypothetical protein
MNSSMESFWIQTPPDGILMQKMGWADLGSKHFAAIRHHLLVRMGTDREPFNGPIHKQVEWPVEAEFKSEDRITIVARYTVTLQEAITSAFSATLSHEVLTKLGSSFDAGADKLAASIKSEVETRVGAVLTSSVQKTVSSTRTFSYETTTEKSESVAFKVPAATRGPATRKVFCYVKMRRLFWDVYLYRVDVLRLEYRKKLLWKDIRNTMTSCEVEMKVPLFRLYYFQPEPALSYAFDRYVPDDEEFEGVTTEPLDTIPKRWPLPETQPLSALARTAFPVSRDEKRAAKDLEKQIRVAAGRQALASAAKLRSRESRATLKRRTAKSQGTMPKAPRGPGTSKKLPGISAKRKGARAGSSARPGK